MLGVAPQASNAQEKTPKIKIAQEVSCPQNWLDKFWANKHNREQVKSIWAWFVIITFFWVARKRVEKFEEVEKGDYAIAKKLVIKYKKQEIFSLCDNVVFDENNKPIYNFKNLEITQISGELVAKIKNNYFYVGQDKKAKFKNTFWGIKEIKSGKLVIKLEYGTPEIAALLILINYLKHK
jgi:hypothetical protein